jgi:hypothetical protein
VEVDARDVWEQVVVAGEVEAPWAMRDLLLIEFGPRRFAAVFAKDTWPIGVPSDYIVCLQEYGNKATVITVNGCAGPEEALKKGEAAVRGRNGKATGGPRPG